MRRDVALLLALILLPAFASAAPVFKPRMRGTEFFGETTTLVADLEDGTYVQLQLAFTNLGPGSNHGLCHALVVRPGGRKWKQSEKYGSDEWSWEGKGDTELLRVGPCVLTHNTSGVKLAAVFDEGRAELEFPGPLSIATPPGASIRTEDALYQSRVLRPFGPARFTLSVDGEAPVKLAGAGYADQSRSDVPPAKLAKEWIRFRALRGSEPLLVLGRRAPDGTVSPLWVWERGAQPTELARFALSDAKKPPAWSVELVGKDGTWGRVTSGALLHRNAPVEDFGLLGRALAPVVGSPVTYTFRAVLSRDGRPDLPGVLEVSFPSE